MAPIRMIAADPPANTFPEMVDMLKVPRNPVGGPPSPEASGDPGTVVTFKKVEYKSLAK